MPMYDYTCQNCHTMFEDILLPMTRRDEPLTEACPVCNGVSTVVHVVGAPNVGDAVRIGRLNLPSGWTDKLSQIKAKHYKSTMHVPTPAKREV